MIADRYYYVKLGKREKAVYKDLYEGIKNFESSVKTVALSNPDKLIDNVYFAVIADNPHLFYVDQSQIRYSVCGTQMEINLTYYFPKSQIKSMMESVQKEAGRIVKEIVNRAGMDEYHREKALYEYFVTHFSYNMAALNTTDPTLMCKAHSLLGVFTEGKAVCEGFAKAFKFLMNAMDIKCIFVTGNADWDYAQGHAWNIVKIHDRAYHVDVTWAITISSNGTVRYDYLNLSDASITIDHTNYKGVPKCIDDDLDYYKNIGIQIDNSIYLKNHIKQCLKDRVLTTTFILVQGTGKCGFRDIKEGQLLVQEAAKKAHIEAGGMAFRYEIKYLEKRNVFTINFSYD